MRAKRFARIAKFSEGLTMNKKIRYFLVMLLAFTAVISTMFCFSACVNAAETVEKLTIENAKINFRVGDTFTYGDGFAVIATYGDGHTQNVTAEAEKRFESGFNMNMVGDYQITVSFGGKREVYTIYVSDFDPVLRKIELDTTNVKLNYELGEGFTYYGLKVTCTYENAQGNQITEVSSSLREFNVELKNKADDSVLEGIAFTKLGEYIVTISKGEVSANYTVKVEGINISTVQNALNIGNIFRTEVVSGNILTQSAVRKHNSYYDMAEYDYSFGKNYTHIVDLFALNGDEYHYSMYDDEIYCVRTQIEGEGHKIVSNQAVQSASINGAPILLWFNSNTEFGIESAILNLYKRGLNCTNKNLKETANVSKREYSFSFSGLENSSNVHSTDYYETKVKFKLGRNYNIETAEFQQDYYENNPVSPNFVTNKETGITVPVEERGFSNSIKVKTNQVAGERTLTNPYDRDTFKVKSFDLSYNGNILDEGATIECAMESGSDKSFAIQLNVENILPEYASFDQDPLKVNLEGSHLPDTNTVTGFYYSGFQVYRQNGSNVINIIIPRGGIYKLTFKTQNVTKNVVLDVTGVNPTEIKSQIANTSIKQFVNGTSKTIALSGEIYFRGTANANANEAQTYEVISENAEYCTIEETTYAGVKCFKFTATQNGEYKIVVTSTPVPGLSCSFTFKVSDLPDFAELLSGKYSVQDAVGDIYELTFTPQTDGLSGTLTVKQTPTDNDNNPITDRAKTQTLSYAVDGFTITLSHVSGDNLGISLEINEKSGLSLIDARGTDYELSRVN